MDKIIVVFCEGDHDIAFLTRVLCSEGYTAYNEKIKDFPKPFKKLYMKNLEEKDIGKRAFKFQRPKRKVPYSIVKKGNTLVVFHNLDGDDNIMNYSYQVVDMYVELNEEILRTTENYEYINFSFLYFVDADDVGVDSRMREFSQMLDIEDMEHNTLYTKDSYEVGCSVFYDIDDSDRKGKLEDIVISLMKPTNEEHFTNAKQYLLSNKLDSQREKKFDCTDEVYVRNSLYIVDKSIISSIGQLQFSGASNAMIISNSDFIQNQDIHNSSICQGIKRLFR